MTDSIPNRRTIAMTVILSLSLEVHAVGGVREQFSKLEKEMEAAVERFAGAAESADADAHKESAADPRVSVLARMDALADDSVGKEDGNYVAVQCFVWSWMFDIDLPKLLPRFERLAQHYPNDEHLPELLDMVPLAYSVSGTPQGWTRQLQRIFETSTSQHVKLTTLSSMGQVLMKSGNPGEAKSAFAKIVKLAPESDSADTAKGLIYELEHLQVGMSAPPFATKTVDGKDISLNDLRGQTVLLNFWATWCPSCVAEIPDLKKTQARFKGKPFVILAVSLDGTKGEVASFVEQSGFPGIHTWHESGPDNPVSELYHAEFLPTWYLIDGNGTIRARDPFHDKLVPAIEAALSGK